MRRTERIGTIGFLVILMLVGFALPGMAQVEPARPSSYDEFDTIESAGDFAKITAEPDTPTYLYIAPGAYTVDNPIEIDRTTSLYLHGSDRHATRLVALNQSLPLFRVVDAPLINISNLRLLPTGFDFSPIEARAILFENSQPSRVEIHDAFIDRGTIEIKGPGTYNFQAVDFTSVGLLSAPLIVDDPGADVTIVGGNINSGQPASPDLCPDPNDCEAYHVWQRKGRLRIFATEVQATLGNADFRIETAATQGPHVVANVRSEGVKCRSDQPAGLVYVPPSSASEAVDLLVMNNRGAWHNHPDQSCPSELGKGRIVEYNAKGTVWLIGNNAHYGAGRLAEGTAGNGATVVALGNIFSGNTDNNCADPRNMLPVANATTTYAGNLYSRGEFCDWCVDLGASHAVCENLTCVGGSSDGQPCLSNDECPDGYCGDRQTDFVYPELVIDDGAIPRFSEITVPLPLRRPTVNNPIQGQAEVHMVDSADCAAGDCAPHYPDHCGTSPPFSDRCVLQATFNKAISDGKPAFVREGSYTVDKPLYWMHKGQAAEDSHFLLTSQTSHGGWIIGQNGNVTIRFEQGQKYCKVGGQPCTTISDCPGPIADACLFPAKTVFATEGMAYGVIQGFTFEGDPFDATCQQDPATPCFSNDDCATGDFCAGASGPSTVEIENDPDVGFSQRAVTFHDCQFIGGRHALAIGIDSTIQCDTNMVVGGSFSDAGLGFGSGGYNALHNVAYDATFNDNAVVIGHDPHGTVPQGGTWALFHVSISGTRVKDIELVGGAQALYHHGVSSDSAKILDEKVYTGVPMSLLFDHNDLAPDPDGLVIEFQHSGGPTFLHSRLDPGTLRLIPSMSVKHAFKLASYIPRWDDIQLDDPEECKAYEWLDDTMECPQEIACPPGCRELACKQVDLGAAACVSDADGTFGVEVCPDGQTIELESCKCKGRGGSCGQSQRWICN